jgi:polyvinyl alcohol dehydrogenase (cytochrome)
MSIQLWGRMASCGRLAIGLVVAFNNPVHAAPDGQMIFLTKCAACHVPNSDHVPSAEALSRTSRASILAALESGRMRIQGDGLTFAERQAVAAFLVPKDTGTVVDLPAVNRCASVKPFAVDDKTGWNGWGVDAANTRFQSRTSLNAGNVPKLTLKWAFGIPKADTAYGQPTAVGGRLFFGSSDGTVYSLDAETGCTIWTFKADTVVRSAISIAASGRGKVLAYFGDVAANVYGVDAESGARIWKVKVDEHGFARITGAPKLYRDRLYVPVSSVEEVPAGDPQYACCTFRGSVVALDAKSGKQMWKSYTIAEKPDLRGKNKNGVERFGPAGAAVWSSPTIDVQRSVVYVGTGDAYADPVAKTSDAVLAFDLQTGALRWAQQLTGGDAWNFSCGRPDKPNCPDKPGPDHDFGSSPILRDLGAGHRVLLAGQKSGIMHALDPDHEGKVLWQTRVGKGSALGGIMWGSAADESNVYVANADGFLARTGGLPGGLFAIRSGTGEVVWHAEPKKPACAGTPGCSSAQLAAVTAIPGVVFSGAMDGHLRGYSIADGTVIWDFDTLRDFETVNGVKAHGGSFSGTGPTVVGNMLYVASGYASLGGMPGNVVLAFENPAPSR